MRAKFIHAKANGEKMGGPVVAPYSSGVFRGGVPPCATASSWPSEKSMTARSYRTVEASCGTIAHAYGVISVNGCSAHARTLFRFALTKQAPP